MPRGAAVIEYRGKRGTTWRIKYVDATGRQCKETLGSEEQGWTRKNAEAELRERLVRVDKKGYRKPRAVTFREFAEQWFTASASKRDWRPSTVAQYKTVRGRLVEFFGAMRVDAIRPRHVAGYIAEMSKKYGAATVGRDVSVLHAIFQSALREELVEQNPAGRAERPKLPERSWRILAPAEVAAVARAFADEQARVAFLVFVTLGIRRSELEGLYWRDVDLIENVLHVRESKSKAGRRSVAIPPRLAEELWQHRRSSRFQGDDEHVFCHPELGSRYDVGEAFREAFTKALEAAGVEGRVRVHDLRHCSLTHAAAAGDSPIALMRRAGHANFATTQQYLDLAGVVFRDEAERLEARLLGAGVGTHSGTHLSPPERTSDEATPREQAVSA